ncbi:hypothetical protein MMC07_001444 [Pseudocyphellaria aurata]|nr:hypothetical protein [Pseudocyphellaria aurata]
MAYSTLFIFSLVSQLFMFLFSDEVLAWRSSRIQRSELPRISIRRPYINSTNSSKFDYVIVGGGTAGLTIASRLSEDPSVQVAVVEAGDYYENTTGNLSRIPANDGLYNGKDPADTGPSDWNFTTIPQAGISNEIIHYARGKTLGGSSALNYMAYQRAPKGVMENWADTIGDESWKYEKVFEYYYKSVNFTPPDMHKRIANSTPKYDVSSLGNTGPLDVTYSNYAQALSTWVAKAMSSVGIAPIDGFTSGSLNGSGWLVSTIQHTSGFRESSESAFLRPYRKRSNLVVFPNTLGEKIVFDGRVAKGVQVSSAGVSNIIYATNEIVVSCGVFQSPQLLQVSGVGPADLLQQHGIEVVANRPGVGQDMNDHIFFPITYRVNVQTESALGYGTEAMRKAIDQFNNEASGLLASAGGDYAGYENVPQELRKNFSQKAIQDLSAFPSDWPELEYFTLPGWVGDFQFPPRGAPNDGYQYGTIMLTSVAPLSRGNISISSSSTHDQPLINPNWLTDPTDVEVMIAAFKRLRQIFQAPVLEENLTIGPEYYPGLNVTTDEQILGHIKRSFNSMYHASSTCKMGKLDDPMAVVDSQGRVIGVEKLRVADASAFPFLPPGLPMGTVYMVAEKIADSIKKRL